MINAGNPSAHNLQMRKYVKEHKQSSSQIFEKLNRRGRLNPAQNAMSAQLTNEQLLRFYVKETEPKLEFSNDDIQGQGGDTNSVLMSEIQRLIDVGNFNAQDAKDTMTTMQTKLINDGRTLAQINIDDRLNIHRNLIKHLQTGFGSVNDSIADNLSFVKTTIDDIADNLAIYSSTNDASSQSIIKSLNDLNTNLEQYNKTGTVSQGALFTSLANLQTALANSNTNNAANTAAIDNLSIILGSMGATPGIGLGGGGGPATGTGGGGSSSSGTGGGGSSSSGTGGGGSPSSGGGGGGGSSSISPLLGPVLPAPPTAPPGSPGAGGGGSGGGLAPPSLSGALGGLGGSSTTTTDPSSGITTTNVVVPQVAPSTQQLVDAATATAAKGGAGAKGGADTVMVAGPKMAIDVGNFPEYVAIKAKNGGAELTMKDYRDILKQVAIELPNLFIEDLQKAKTTTGKIQKVETYVNNLNKAELGAFSKKILIQKYKLDDATRKLQEVSGRSVLSRQYGDTKIATHELQNVMRRGIAANKYIDILNASRQQQKEKQISSATRIQTNIRSKLARQAFEREVMLNTSFTSTVFDPSMGFSEEELDAFFA